MPIKIVHVTLVQTLMYVLTLHHIHLFGRLTAVYTLIDVTKLTLHMTCAHIKNKVHVALVCSLIRCPSPTVYMFFGIFDSLMVVYTLLDVTKLILYVICSYIKKIVHVALAIL